MGRRRRRHRHRHRHRCCHRRRYHCHCHHHCHRHRHVVCDEDFVLKLSDQKERTGGGIMASSL